MIFHGENFKKDYNSVKFLHFASLSLLRSEKYEYQAPNVVRKEKRARRGDQNYLSLLQLF